MRTIYRDWTLKRLTTEFINRWHSVHTTDCFDTNTSMTLDMMEAELNRRGYEVRERRTPIIVDGKGDEIETDSVN